MDPWANPLSLPKNLIQTFDRQSGKHLTEWSVV
jgi:hypothetical protein